MRMSRLRFTWIFLALGLALRLPAPALTISDDEAREAGQRIWKNECSGSVSGLTSWNAGEDFASVGIGHFIWYPKGRRGPFEESFPKLVAYLREQGVQMPDWLTADTPCPWNSQQEFRADFNGERMTGLRRLLSSTVAHQARFAALRLEAALPLMLESIPADQRPLVQKRFEAVAASPNGIYVLVDYVNFKGEGVKASERYQGQGWGLLQVLQDMKSTPVGWATTREFAAAADRMLTRRVRNSPPERGESRWLQGWRNRLSTYTH